MIVLAMQPRPDPYATVFYTLEARRRTGTYESALAGDAMIIHKVEDYGTAYSVDADVPPADVSNNEGSMFKPGEAWQSPDRSRWLRVDRSEEHTSELQSLMRNSYAVVSLNKKNNN